MTSRSSPASSAVVWPSLALPLLLVSWGILARFRSEHWWWVATLDLIPPQVVLPLIVWLLWHTRRSIWFLWNGLFTLLFVVFQVGLSIHLSPASGGPAGPLLTLMSLNAHYASAPPLRLAEVAAREGVSVITVQEAQNREGDGAAFENGLRAAFPGWGLRREGQLLTLTRLPVESSRLVHFANSEHSVLVTQVIAGDQVFTVVNTHLPTLALRPTEGEPAGFFDRVNARLAERRAMPDAVMKIISSAPGAVLLAGDLNAPPRGELQGLLRHTGLEDAFAEAGQGFGFTYHQRFGFLRLDYVWGRGVTFGSATVLPDVLSDHRALLVRFQLQ